MVVYVLQIGQFSINFEYKIDYNSKNRDCKNQKIYFSFVSAHSASSIKMGPYLSVGEGGGSAYP